MQHLADGPGHRQPVVGVHVYLAHAVADAALDLRYRYPPGLTDGAAVGVEQVLQLLRHRRGAVHHQMGVGQAPVDLFDAGHGQHLAVGLMRELVGAVAGADRHRQGVHPGVGHEPLRFVRVGQQLLAGQGAGRAVAILLVAGAGFQRPEHADLPFHGDPAGMGHLRHRAGDAHVVVVVGGGLGILGQRAIHHHRGEPLVDGPAAGGRAVAVILVHGDRNLRIQLHRRQDQVPQVRFLGIAARAARGLDDDRRLGSGGRGHDRLNLFHVVDVEGRQSVVVFGGMIEEDTHWYQWHGAPIVAGTGAPATARRRLAFCAVGAPAAAGGQAGGGRGLTPGRPSP